MSPKIRMGTIYAKADPKTVPHQVSTPVTLSLTIPANNAVLRAIVVGREGTQEVKCSDLRVADPYSKFTCMVPNYVMLRAEPKVTNWNDTVKTAQIIAFDITGEEMATADFEYSEIECPN